jgi:hypothetical protein
MATTEGVPLPNLNCPLCGEPNACAPAACGSFDVECWCNRVTIDAQALERARTRDACLCRACAKVGTD